MPCRTSSRRSAIGVQSISPLNMIRSPSRTIFAACSRDTSFSRIAPPQSLRCRWRPTGKPVAPSNTPAGRNPEQEPPAKAGARVEGSSLGIGLIGGLVFARENSPAEQTGQLDVQITRQWDGLWDQMELLHASLYITGAQAIAKP